MYATGPLPPRNSLRASSGGDSPVKLPCICETTLHAGSVENDETAPHSVRLNLPFPLLTLLSTDLINPNFEAIVTPTGNAIARNLLTIAGLEDAGYLRYSVTARIAAAFDTDAVIASLQTVIRNNSCPDLSFGDSLRPGQYL